MAKTILHIEDGSDPVDVTLTSGDFIRVNADLRKEGLDFADTPLLEYRSRLAHRALIRTGRLEPDTDFLTWADKLEDVGSVDAEEDDAGEAPATLTS